MKTQKSVWIMIVVLMLSVSCKRENLSTSLNLEEDEAAEIIASYICTDNGGLSSLFKETALYSASIDSPEKALRETIYDTTFTIANQQGSKISYSYTISYEYGYRYNAQFTAFEFYMNYNSDGTYSSSRMKSDDSSEGSLQLKGIEQDETDYIISGSVTRTGHQTTLFREEKSITASMLFNFDNIKIDKTDYSIKSGTGSIKLSGETSGGLTFSFNGEVNYTANESIILTLNGEGYTIGLISGEIL